MARFPRIIIPHMAHHATQRGNRRQPVFFRDQDYEEYLQLLREWTDRYHVKIVAYCLMPNHVHLILIPSDQVGMTYALTETHRRYARSINFRKDWRGHLWQGRFFSVPLEDEHLDNAVRYVEQNALRAGLVGPEQAYPWASSQSHSSAAFSDSQKGEFEMIAFRMKSWRPIGSDGLRNSILEIYGIDINPEKPGPKANS